MYRKTEKRMMGSSIFVFIFARCFIIGGLACSRITIPSNQINSAQPKNVINVLFFSKDMKSCADSCLYVTDCKSINYDSLHKVCEWLGDYKDPTRMVHDLKGYLFIDMNEWKQVRQPDPCSDKPCLSKEQCVPDTYSYICTKLDHCNGLYLTMLDSDDFQEAVNLSSIKDGSEKTDLFLYSHNGVLFDGWYNQYIQINISKGPFTVRGVITKGNPVLEARVTLYRVALSDNCKEFKFLRDEGGLPQNFTGNALDDDFDTPSISYLDEPITGGCIRVYFRGYTYTLSLRMDLVGCFVK